MYFSISLNLIQESSRLLESHQIFRDRLVLTAQHLKFLDPERIRKESYVDNIIAVGRQPYMNPNDWTNMDNPCVSASSRTRRSSLRSAESGIIVVSMMFVARPAYPLKHLALGSDSINKTHLLGQRMPSSCLAVTAYENVVVASRKTIL